MSQKMTTSNINTRSNSQRAKRVQHQKGWLGIASEQIPEDGDDDDKNDQDSEHDKEDFSEESEKGIF